MYKTGDLLLVKNYSFIGNMIRKILDSEYNHVGLFVTDDEVIEATFKGVYKTDISKFEELRDKNKLEFNIYRFREITETQLILMIDYALGNVGMKYDFWQLITLYLFFLLHINRKIEPIDVCNAWICSELIGESAEHAGIRFQGNVDSDNITPKDIYTSLKVELIK